MCALPIATLTSAGVGDTFSARSYWARRSVVVSESDGGSFARCARTASMPRSAMGLLHEQGFCAGMGAVGNSVYSPAHDRSAERRVGKECVITCRSRLSPYPSQKKD